MVNTMGWNERSDPDMRTANFCDVYREGVYRPLQCFKHRKPRLGARAAGVRKMAR